MFDLPCVSWTKSRENVLGPLLYSVAKQQQANQHPRLYPPTQAHKHTFTHTHTLTHKPYKHIHTFCTHRHIFFLTFYNNNATLSPPHTTHSNIQSLKFAFIHTPTHIHTVPCLFSYAYPYTHYPLTPPRQHAQAHISLYYLSEHCDC